MAARNNVEFSYSLLPSAGGRKSSLAGYACPATGLSLYPDRGQIWRAKSLANKHGDLAQPAALDHRAPEAGRSLQNRALRSGKRMFAAFALAAGAVDKGIEHGANYDSLSYIPPT
jgi:hypothetical protein